MTVIFTLLFSMMLHAHPLHVSFTSIDISEERSEANLSFKFYTDDFSLLFFHLYEKNIQPAMDQELTKDQLKIINSYFKRAFALVAGRDTLDLEFIRKDQDDLNIWLYYKGSWPENKDFQVFLTNMLMLDLYEDQTNLVIVTNGKHEQGYTFDYRNRRFKLDVKQD